MNDLVDAAEAADAVLALVRMRRDLAGRLLAAGCTEYVELLHDQVCLDGYFSARHLRIVADALDQARVMTETAGEGRQPAEAPAGSQ